jgi:NAD(P)-dependent dehydrogenase (short-subunit alcohol dehydrogenase family)
MGILEGKIALITGGSSGIGRATALAFAREGARVVIAARRAERGDRVVEEIKAAGGEGLFVAADVSQADQVEALVGGVVERYGRLDCAFNNASSHETSFAKTADFGEDEFDRTVAVNLKGVWLGMKYEIRHMLRQEPRGGVIVNTSSVNALGGVAQGSLYAATKAGVLALTKSAALEYAAQGIRVNALVPGAFRTPMLEHGMDIYAGGDPELRERVEEGYRQVIAMGRIGQPEEAAEAVVWLCSKRASYVTGHSMIVDGGLSAPLR